MVITNNSSAASYADIAHPLHQLTNKGSLWAWSDVEQQAFDSLKKAISTEPVLWHPNLQRDMELWTDASTVAVGAVLQQRDDAGHPHPVAFASRVLTSAETRYYTQELECLAVIFGLIKFRTYLLGRHFRVFTDHQALLSVLTKPSPSSRITRWSLAMQEYDCKFVHIAGIANVVPDALTRQSFLIAMVPTTQPEWQHHQQQDAFCVETIRQQQQH